MAKYQKDDRVWLAGDLTGVVIDTYPKGRVYALVIEARGNMKPSKETTFLENDHRCHKVECQAGYRFVSSDETVREGDQIYIEDHWSSYNIYYSGDRSAFIIRRKL